MEGRRRFYRLAFLLAAACAGSAAQTGAIDFNRDIRPILSDRCYTCHGPDESKRKSKLRLDTEAGAKADLGGHFAIVPGDSGTERTRPPGDCERSSAADASGLRSGRSSTEREIDLLTRWIAQGAQVAEALVVSCPTQAGPPP